MKFKTDAYTDIGIKKEVNQDALIIKRALTSQTGRVCFACLCDGMGGLSYGEIASATFINRMERWFNEEFPSVLLDENLTVELNTSMNEVDYFKSIEAQWNKIVQQINHKLKKYGNEKGLKLGTTAVAILVMGGKYLVMSVGDTRAYAINGGSLRQITHDHSYVQQQMDLGRMTKAEAEVSKQKSVLLQCIGASERVVPDFHMGNVDETTFFLCSDGLWRKLSDAEIVNNVEKSDGIKHLAGIVKQRGETDNISGLMIKAKTC